MPRYYCDYCDTYLTHDSPSVRNQHNAGYKHKANLRSYYQQFEEQQTQSLIDQRIKEHLGQTAAFQQQVGATFHQHLASFSNSQRHHLPLLPPPVVPIAGSQPPVNSPLVPDIRPPILPRPVAGAPGWTKYLWFFAAFVLLFYFRDNYNEKCENCHPSPYLVFHISELLSKCIHIHLA